MGSAGQQTPRAGHAATHVRAYAAKAPVNAKTHVLRALRRSIPSA